VKRRDEGMAPISLDIAGLVVFPFNSDLSHERIIGHGAMRLSSIE
jgi:hypothetical protein